MLAGGLDQPVLLEHLPDAQATFAFPRQWNPLVLLALAIDRYFLEVDVDAALAAPGLQFYRITRIQSRLQTY